MIYEHERPKQGGCGNVTSNVQCFRDGWMSRAVSACIVTWCLLYVKSPGEDKELWYCTSDRCWLVLTGVYWRVFFTITRTVAFCGWSCLLHHGDIMTSRKVPVTVIIPDQINSDRGRGWDMEDGRRDAFWCPSSVPGGDSHPPSSDASTRQQTQSSSSVSNDWIILVLHG